MAIVEFSPQAKDDLEGIIIYVSEYSLESAKKTVKELIGKFKILAENPKLGVLKDKYFIEIRSFPYKNYVIFYFPIEDGIEIYRVIHGARDIDDLFDEIIEGLKP
jgi:toxin ParE1/3/4